MVNNNIYTWVLAILCFKNIQNVLYIHYIINIQNYLFILKKIYKFRDIFYFKNIQNYLYILYIKNIPYYLYINTLHQEYTKLPKYFGIYEYIF